MDCERESQREPYLRDRGLTDFKERWWWRRRQGDGSTVMEVTYKWTVGERESQRELYLRDRGPIEVKELRRWWRRWSDDGGGGGEAMMTIAALREATTIKEGERKRERVREGEGEIEEEDDDGGGGRTTAVDSIRPAQWRGGRMTIWEAR